jgi:hypothetical protein
LTADQWDSRLLHPYGAILRGRDETQGGKLARGAIGVDPIYGRYACFVVGKDLAIEGQFRAGLADDRAGRFFALRGDGQREKSRDGETE